MLYILYYISIYHIYICVCVCVCIICIILYHILYFIYIYILYINCIIINIDINKFGQKYRRLEQKKDRFPVFDLRPFSREFI